MKRYRFEAAIQRSTGWGCFVLFPHDVRAEFGTAGRVPVKALFSGVPYTGSLMPTGAGYHALGVTREIRTQLGKAPGDLICVELWRDDETRTIELPPEFNALLVKEGLLERFAELTFTRRKEYRNWITSAKRSETRLRRMAKAVEMLRNEAPSRHTLQQRITVANE